MSAFFIFKLILMKINTYKVKRLTYTAVLLNIIAKNREHYSIQKKANQIFQWKYLTKKEYLFTMFSEYDRIADEVSRFSVVGDSARNLEIGV